MSQDYFLAYSSNLATLKLQLVSAMHSVHAVLLKFPPESSAHLTDSLIATAETLTFQYGDFLDDFESKN